MDRRVFLQTGGAAAVPSLQSQPKSPPRKVRMKVGTQHGSSDDILRVMAALGVNHICGTEPTRKLDENWSVEGLSRLRERVEGFGIKLDMLPLPLSSTYITRAEMPNIILGKSPERDREIDQICQMIRNAARAGIPALKYNLTVLGVVRTESTPGRGGRGTAPSFMTRLSKTLRSPRPARSPRTSSGSGSPTSSSA